jgi:hypothetical protein
MTTLAGSLRAVERRTEQIAGNQDDSLGITKRVADKRAVAEHLLLALCPSRFGRRSAPVPPRPAPPATVARPRGARQRPSAPRGSTLGLLARTLPARPSGSVRVMTIGS